MLCIRLTRTGKVHSPHYRIVVQEKRSKLDGKCVDIIGHYHPAERNKPLVLDEEKAKKWLKVGAQPSATVTNLLVKRDVLGKDRTIHFFFTPGKKEEPKAEKSEVKAEEETATEVAGEDVPEAEITEGAAEEMAEVDASTEAPAEVEPAQDSVAKEE